MLNARPYGQRGGGILVSGVFVSGILVSRLIVSGLRRRE